MRSAEGVVSHATTSGRLLTTKTASDTVEDKYGTEIDAKVHPNRVIVVPYVERLD